MSGICCFFSKSPGLFNQRCTLQTQVPVVALPLGLRLSIKVFLIDNNRVLVDFAPRLVGVEFGEAEAGLVSACSNLVRDVSCWNLDVHLILVCLVKAYSDFLMFMATEVPQDECENCLSGLLLVLIKVVSFLIIFGTIIFFLTAFVELVVLDVRIGN